MVWYYQNYLKQDEMASSHLDYQLKKSPILILSWTLYSHLVSFCISWVPEGSREKINKQERQTQFEQNLVTQVKLLQILWIKKEIVKWSLMLVFKEDHMISCTSIFAVCFTICLLSTCMVLAFTIEEIVWAILCVGCEQDL